MTGNSDPTTRESKRGWWRRFLESLAKANKEALKKGCKG
jgi:hypothetical protein